VLSMSGTPLYSGGRYTGSAISKYLQNPFANCICFGVRHSASNNRGDATITHMHFAREVATLSLFSIKEFHATWSIRMT
jgi:hypothetical protein